MEFLTPNRKRKSYNDPQTQENNMTPKRVRWQLSKESPTSSPNKVPEAATQQLGDLLQGLEKEQLVAILTTLAKDNNLEQNITQLLPRPTLSNITKILLGLEKKCVILYHTLPKDLTEPIIATCV